MLPEPTMPQAAVVCDDGTVGAARDGWTALAPKDVAFLDALPRNPSGKVLERELRAAEAR